MCKDIMEKVPVGLIVDYHGHSKLKNIFMYGNIDDSSPADYYLFPYIVSQECELFSFKESRFGVQKSKASTARIALWKIVNCPYVYTIESSFYKSDKCKGDHLTNCDLMVMGEKLAESILRLYKDLLKSGAVLAAENDTKIELLQLLSAKEYECLHGDDSGSDSNPSEDDLASTIAMLNVVADEKRTKSVLPDRKSKDSSLLKCNSQRNTQIKIGEAKSRFMNSKKV
jgi:hypothetical protein